MARDTPSRRTELACPPRHEPSPDPAARGIVAAAVAGEVRTKGADRQPGTGSVVARQSRHHRHDACGPLSPPLVLVGDLHGSWCDDPYGSMPVSS
jgi:hypothetical protein